VALRLLLVLLALVPARAAVLIRDVNIVDVESGRVFPHRSVLISGTEIKAVGASRSLRSPRKAAVVNGAGKFLIPGLWDMHVHLWYAENEFPLYLAWGVTGVRDMGSDLARTRSWQHAVDAGKLLGPHVITCGSPLDGRDSGDPKLPVIVVKTPADARRDYDVLESEHVDFIKVLSSLPADAYFALLDRARKWGLPVVGHVPSGVTVAQAVEARQHSMEHLMGMMLAGSPDEIRIRRELLDAAAHQDGKRTFQLYAHAMDTFDWNRAGDLFAQMKLFDAWQTPTLIMWRRALLLDADAMVGDAELKRIPKSIRAGWKDPRPEAAAQPPENREFAKRQYELYQEIVFRMQAAGVPLLAGTDTGDPWSYPGEELHEELALMVKAGLKPVEALRTATVNPARFLDGDDLGRVAPGYVADLVLLDANPLEDIRNTRRIAAVVSAGHYLTRSKLNAMVAAMNR
jgi:imidazolonepropionase-like amidohydrolase